MIRERWFSLSQRERRAVLLGAVGTAVTVGYLLLEPFLVERDRLASEVPLLRQDLAQMQDLVAEVKKLQVEVSAPVGELSPVTLGQMARGAASEPDAVMLSEGYGGLLNVAFERVDYRQLVDLLAAIEGRRNGAITRIKIDQLAETPGLVAASFAVTVTR